MQENEKRKHVGEYLGVKSGSITNSSSSNTKYPLIRIVEIDI